MSLLTNAAKVAHSAAASVLAKAQIRAGAAIPSVMLKDRPDKATVRLDTLKGKNIIVRTPHDLYVIR